MCTVTFIPRGNGFYVAMNRDEQIARPKAGAPAVFQYGGVESIYPLDFEGGTWIAANSRGVAFTLLNWNDAPILREKTRTRGCVIPAVASSDCGQAAHSALTQLDLEGILPFKLVGFFPEEEGVIEWRWDQRVLKRNLVPWDMRQWCSSSLSDAQASLRRALTFQRGVKECDCGSLAWLRRLHASHDQELDPFSHCVHRARVETLSYTELVCTPRNIECHYLDGSPCRVDGAIHRVSLPRLFPPERSVRRAAFTEASDKSTC